MSTAAWWWSDLYWWRTRRMLRRPGAISGIVADMMLGKADYCQEQANDLAALAALDDPATATTLQADADQWHGRAVECRQIAAEYYDQADQRIADRDDRSR